LERKIKNVPRALILVRSGNSSIESGSYLKNADYVQGQDAGRRKSGAYTVVCEQFEEASNAVIGR
jgi:hypothetical protein